MKLHKPKHKGAKVLLLDIETKPLKVYAWGLGEQNLSLEMLAEDWAVLSWSAKWYDPEGKTEYPVMYADNRRNKNLLDDKKLLQGMWELLDQADIVVGHNSKRFDIKKLNARFKLQKIKGGMAPSSFRQIDTLSIAKKNFAMTSNKLEYLADKLGVKHKKLKDRKYGGFSLWRECMKHNMEAWEEMELYNKRDVLALQGVYESLQSWDNSIDFNVYRETQDVICACGSHSFLKRGFVYSNTGKFQRLRCNKCGKETKSKVNELSKEKRQSLKRGEEE